MLSGYRVIITGATSGIGLATAKEFLNQGAKVIGMGRNFTKTEGLGENFTAFKCDVTQESEIIAAVKFAKEKFGAVDSLICNAGSAITGNTENVDAEDFERGFKLYLNSHAMFTKYAVPLLRKSKNPSITHTASVASFMIGDSIPYNVLKAALLNYTRQSAAGLLNKNPVDISGRPTGVAPLLEGENPYIRVNAVCPGLIRTNLMPDAAWEALGTDEALKAIPSRRIGEDWEVAKLFAFLASPKAGFITGATITIDGGWWTTHARV
ncbi:MAG: SDR family NAD(P)-dependent oxidoreductase [Suipraeoptans sp.]